MTYEEWKNKKDKERYEASEKQNAVTEKSPSKAEGDKNTGGYETWKQRRHTNARSTATDRVNQWLSEVRRFSDAYTARYKDGNQKYRTDSAYWLENATKSRDLMRDMALDIGKYMEENRHILGDDFIAQATDMIREGRKFQSSVVDQAQRERDYYSQWENEDAYNADMKKREEYEAKRSFDTKAGRQEIARLENDLKIYQDLSRWETDEKGRSRLEELKKQYGSEEGIRDLITQKNAYLTEAERIQNADMQFRKDYEAKRSFDTEAGKREVAQLENALKEYQSLSRWETDERGKQRLEELKQQYGDEKGIRDLITQKNAYLTEVKRIQNADRLSQVSQNHDFRDFSGYTSTHNDSPWSRLTGTEYDETYEYINNKDGIRDEITQKHRSYSGDNPWSDGEFVLEEKGYDRLTPDEVAIYNYHYAKNGKETAQEYLDSIQETLNRRKSDSMVEVMRGNTGLELAFALAVGIDQWESGMKSLLNTGGEYTPVSATQMASAQVWEDLGERSKAAGVAYDVISTTANMAPSILTSVAANALVPGSGAVIGSAMMGASAGGSAYQEMINAGYSKEQARVYGTMVGASESILGNLLGGISSLGGHVSGHFVSNVMNKVDNVIARTAIKIGGNMLSEGFEEGLQEMLTPWFKSVLTGEKYEVASEDVLYAGLLGALSAGLLEGPTTIAGAHGVHQQGLELKAAGIEPQRLAEIGQTFSADTVAYQLAGRVGENTDAYTMGRLFNEIDAELTQLNKDSITSSLMSKGMEERHARKLADGFAAVVTGTPLTEAQASALVMNDVLAQTVREVIIDPNSTVNQRSRGFNEVLRTLTEGGAEAAPEVNPEVMPTTMETENAAPENQYEAPADGKTILKTTGETVGIRNIAQSQDGKLRLNLEDGRTVDAEDVSFGSEGEAMVYSAVAELNVHPAAANLLVESYHLENTDAEVYAKGIQEAYRFGENNYPMSMAAKGPFTSLLTPRQRDVAYQMGQTFGGKQVAKAQAIARTTAVKNTGPGKVHFDGDRATLSERQQVSLTALDRVASALGVQIHIFESEVVDGKHVGKNGWFDPNDNSIHIDLYAGEQGKNTILFTASHELTHFVKKWSPAKFKVLSNFLMQEYGKQGATVDNLVQEQIRFAKEKGRTLSQDQAFEEVIANSMEQMLADGNVVEKLEKLKSQDRSLWEKIQDYVKDLAARIKKVYEGIRPDSEEGRYVAEMKDAIEELQNLFAEGLSEAGSNYQAAMERGEKTQKNTAEEGGVMYSEREHTGFEEHDIISAVYQIRNEKAARGHDLVQIGTMPELYRDLFGLTGNVYVSNEHLYQNMVSRAEAEADGRFKADASADYHNLGEEKIINAIEQFQNPLLLMESLKDFNEPRLVALLDEKGNDGQHLIAVLELYSPIRAYGSSDMRSHVLITIYEKNSLPDYIEKTVDKGRILHKKEGLHQIRQAGLRLAGEISEETLKKNVARFNKKVKEFREKHKISYQERTGEGVSSRAMLADAFEGLAQTDLERKKVQEYREKAAQYDAEEQKLRELRGQIKELSFAKGPRDKKQLLALQTEATRSANRINIYDKQLLRLEASAPLKAVLEREKAKTAQRIKKQHDKAMAEYRAEALRKQESIAKRYQESRKQGIENRNRTAARHKVQRIVDELNQYLLKGTKDRHVPENLQKAVAEALNVVNMDTVGAEERIAKLREELMAAKTPEKIQEISRKIDSVQAMGDRMKDRLQALKNAYAEFIESEDSDIQNAYDDVVVSKMETVIETVGDTPLRDMSITQLEDVYDMYKAVLTVIRNANKAFKAGKNQQIGQISAAVMDEIRGKGKNRKLSTAFMESLRKFGWDNLKPVYAFEMIGSGTLADLFRNVRSGEDAWAQDVSEAREFYRDTARKHNAQSWDRKKRYEFESTSGMSFSLDLEQIMSLYAYSKREQAADHLRRGGIVFDETTEVTMKTKMGIPVKFNPTEATAYNISDVTLGEIVGSLTEEQKRFVDEMQEYLSKTMGAKGNEVSMEMYGIRLFKEKNYFPLKSAQQFMAKAKEQQKGEVKIKNSGFSKATVKHASNPVVLTPFMNVWADHVNEMSMYHAFVLPMEDFYRVYNFKTPTSEVAATESVEMLIQNAFGKGATKYIDQLLKDLNGGARTDPTVGLINKGIAAFKKGAVLASASVVIQQPSAVARALAMVDARYFIGKLDKQKHGQLWGEVKKYAPVAIIKEMGYFDTNMGKSTEEFILGKEYGSITEKAKALVTDGNYRDEILSRLPALADEMSWCTIWQAVKRETIDKHPGMMTRNREEFMKIVGKRFTEVIVKTQVYDSVLSRSALMRSKDTGMKMATAFMAEPTTSINMITDALVKAKQGNGKAARTTIGAVIASQILNAMLRAIVRAAQDDDEEKSLTEKYIASVVGDVADSMNPLTYIPILQDIVSIVQGYDVERSDMSVISDLWNAWQKLDNQNLSAWQKVESFGGSIAQIFGLPLKNIMRDIRALWQVYDGIVNGEKTTAAGIRYAVQGTLTGKDVSNQKQLYEAEISGDEDHAQRVRGRYKDESKATSAMRSEIRERYKSGELDRQAAMDQLVRLCGMNEDDAYWRIEEWDYALNPDSSEDYSKYNKFYDAVRTGVDLKKTVKEYTDNGVEQKTLISQITEHFKGEYVGMDQKARNAIRGYIVNGFVYCGMDREEAAAKVSQWDVEAKYGIAYDDRYDAYLKGEISGKDLEKILTGTGGMTQEDAAEKIVELDAEKKYGFRYEDRRTEYRDGKISAAQLKEALMGYGGMTESEADRQIKVYDWQNDGINISSDQIGIIEDYETYCEPANITRDVYWDTYLYYQNSGSSERNSKVKACMPYIDSLPLTAAQKTALALCWWAESTVRKYKTW